MTTLQNLPAEMTLHNESIQGCQYLLKQHADDYRNGNRCWKISDCQDRANADIPHASIKCNSHRRALIVFQHICDDKRDQIAHKCHTKYSDPDEDQF